MRRVGFIVLLAALVAACSPDATEPPVEPGVHIQHVIAVAGKPGSIPGFNFLEPIVEEEPKLQGQPDLSLHPTVVICELVGGVCGTIIATRNAKPDFDDPGEGGVHYRVDWRANDPRLSEDALYRITVSEGQLVLGYADLVFDPARRDKIDRSLFAVVKRNALLPIKFRVQKRAVGVIAGGGGTVTSLNRDASLVVPANALGAETAISIVPSVDPIAAPNTPTVVPGTTFTFNPDGLVFGAPAQLTLAYDPAVLPGGAGAETRLGIFRFSAGVWALMEGTIIDAVAHTVTASINGFSSYSIGVIPAGITGRFTAGDAHSCAIRVGSGTFCWGLNDFGQLGNGATSRAQTTPVLVTGSNNPGPGSGYRVISAGLRHTCALDGSGNAWCWGQGAQGQLGQGANASSTVPVRAAVGFRFVDITTGAFHSCGLTSAGEMWCWGSNTSGELGNGSTTQALAPVRVTAPAGVLFATISAGGLNTCALATTQDGYCWGSNVVGQLGDGTNTDRHVPTPVAGGHKFQSLVIASVNSFLNAGCGVEPDGSAWCWGNNSVGQLGTGTSPNICTFFGQGAPFPCAWTPQRVSGSFVYDLVIPGDQHTCGQTRTGQLACWGLNTVGQLGDGTRSTRHTPTLVTVPGTVTLAGIGGTFSCAQSTTGIYCWGNSSVGQVGTGVDSFEPLPVQVSGGPFQTLSANPCAGDASGAISCWGLVPVGAPSTSTINDFTQTNVPTAVGGTALQQISGNGQIACGLDAANHAHCWGRSFADGTNSPTPIPVPGNHTFTSISASNTHACGVDNGSVWCWGSNLRGQFGNNTFNNSSGTPVQSVTSATFSSVSAGTDFTCGVTTSALVYCWGVRNLGQGGTPWPGSPTSTIQAIPVQVPGVTGATRVSAGGSHACAITSSALICWGSNNAGQLGVSTPSAAGGLPPTLVPGLAGVTDVSASQTLNVGTTCAVAAGDLYCWGNNSGGQLGDGTFDNRFAPNAVGLSGVSRVVIGGLGTSATTCALRSNGTVYCFGNNASGSVGAPLPFVLTPARVL